MNIKEWNRIKEVFQRAIDLSDAERAAFLEKECEGEENIRENVQRLLESDGQAVTFLENPATLVPLFNLATEVPDKRIGSQIGGYTITGILGQGGMGTVYRAEKKDQSFQRTVALKVVKRGLDTRSILKRFYTERRILASIEHPNIARFIDGGMTGDDLPYFIIEHVDGRPITDYCDAINATIDERLRLFIQVCEAVQYAHRNLIVHRDLKPSNILVTNDGNVKLLDFGIAKMLASDDPAQSVTRTGDGFPAMTPEYASPEQIHGDQITTASDVYALGILLYELLSGYRPYEFKTRSYAEIDKTISSADPQKPSTLIGSKKTVAGSLESVCRVRSTSPARLRRELSGDLDNIVMMALRKEADRRYQSAEQLLNDLRRYQSNLPVTARPDTIRYRTVKFMRRHTYTAMAAIAFVIALVAGIISTSMQAHVANEARITAEEQRILAERRFNDVRELARRFMFDFHDEIENLAGSRSARELLVSSALEYLERLAAEAGDDWDLVGELANAYVRVGDIQGNPYMANLGNTAGALAAYRSAFDLRTELAEHFPDDPVIQRSLAQILNKTGDLHQWAGNVENALESFERAKEILMVLSASRPENPDVQRELAASHLKTGDAHAWNGRNEEALPHYQAALTIIEHIAAADPQSLRDAVNLSIAHSKVGYIHTQLGILDSALTHHRTALDITTRFSIMDPDNATLRRSLNINTNQVGAVYMAMGNPAAALEQFRNALAIVLEIHVVDPGDPLIVSDITFTHNKIGEALTALGDFPGALLEFKAANTLREKLASNDPTNEGFQRDLAISLYMVGNAHMAISRDRNAREDWLESRRWFERSRDAFLAMKERGTIREVDRNRPDELQALIDECTAKIHGLDSGIE